MGDAQLRASLLGVKGVGEETADDILLYAYHRGVFIYDAYARRLLAAAGWGDYTTYAQARKACDERIRSEALSVEEYGLLHGLIVQAGKRPELLEAGKPTGLPLLVTRVVLIPDIDTCCNYPVHFPAIS